MRVSLIAAFVFISPVLAQDKPATPERFLAVADSLKGSGKYDPKNGSTYCNFFARDFVKQIVGHALPEMTGQANQQYDKLTASKDWSAFDLIVGDRKSDKGKTPKELQALQDKGRLVLYTWKHPKYSLELPLERQKLHGHIAVGVPLKTGDKMIRSETWGTKEHPIEVPMVAQAGKSVYSYGPLSKGFGPDRKDKIKVFILNEK